MISCFNTGSVLHQRIGVSVLHELPRWDLPRHAQAGPVEVIREGAADRAVDDKEGRQMHAYNLDASVEKKGTRE